MFWFLNYYQFSGKCGVRVHIRDGTVAEVRLPGKLFVAESFGHPGCINPGTWAGRAVPGTRLAQATV
jgi:hypothetical protein